MVSTTKACKRCTRPMDASDGPRRYYHAACLVLVQTEARQSQRRCKRCKKLFAGSSFSDDVTRSDGKFPWCKTCQNAYGVGNRFQDSDAELNGHTCPLCDTLIRGHANRRFCSLTCKNRQKGLRLKFNLEIAQFRAMVDATEGRCPLCQNRVRQWHVDHNHKTGKVTGVVCAACNVGALAMTYHDVEYVRRLLAYLETTPAERLGIDVTAPEDAQRPSTLHKSWARQTKYERKTA